MKSGQYLEKEDRQFAEEQGILQMMDSPTVFNPMSIPLYDGTTDSADKIVDWFVKNKQFTPIQFMVGLLRHSVSDFANDQIVAHDKENKIRKDIIDNLQTDPYAPKEDLKITQIKHRLAD